MLDYIMVLLCWLMNLRFFDDFLTLGLTIVYFFLLLHILINSQDTKIDSKIRKNKTNS